MRIEIESITVGDRTRKSLGDIDALANSIKQVGMLHPIVVNSRNELICGARRLEAARRLGWSDIDVTVVSSADDAMAAITAERDENTCREALTPTEAVELGKRIEALERPAAEAREKAGCRPSGNLPQGETGRVADKAAAAAGMGRRTYQKAKDVVAAAQAPDATPEVKQAAEVMDKTGKVDPAHKLVMKSTGRGATRKAGAKAKKIGAVASRITTTAGFVDAIRAISDACDIVVRAWKRFASKRLSVGERNAIRELSGPIAKLNYILSDASRQSADE